MKALSSKDFYALLIWSAGIGFVVGLVTAIVMRILGWGIDILWHRLPHMISPNHEFSIYPLLVCTIGGLLVGLCQHYLGDHPQPFEKSLARFRETGRFEYRYLPHGQITTLISLIFGGSLGPEAALVDLVGGLSTFLTEKYSQRRRMRRALRYASISGMLAALFRSPIGGAVLPLEEPGQERLSGFWRIIPGLVAAIFGLAAFLWLAGGLFGEIVTDAPRDFWEAGDLLWAIPVALVGTGGGTFYVLLHRHLPKITSPLTDRKIIRGLIGGIGLGILGSWMPLTLFSGQHEFETLVNQGMEMGVFALLLLAAAKLLATNLCLSTGWKGGHIFPLMFSGAALGLACHAAVPALHPLVAVVAAMSAATVVVLRQPIAVILIMVVMIQIQFVAVVTLATLLGYLLTRPLFPKAESV